MTAATALTTEITEVSPEENDTQPLLLDVSDITLIVTSEQFDALCTKNPDLRLELTPDLELIVMAPAGGESSEKNLDLSTDVCIWNRQTKLGRAFDSSGGYNFEALGGGKPSPDVSWIEKSRLEGVNIVKFIPVVPDFVIELRSATVRVASPMANNLKPAQKKMLVYQQVGVRMGLLIDPRKQRVEIYRPGQETEILEAPKSIDCNEVMPGFILDLSRIW
jgi:Uma2 family endonuclease